MVRLPQGYCIDSTEVTRAQYAGWLATTPSTAVQIQDCTWNASFAPNASCMSVSSVCQSGCDNHPQVCVDWCDAYAYCQAVGKRLCGKIGGGSNAFADYADAGLSQWYSACTSNAPTLNVYPYGQTYDGQACNGWDYTGTTFMTIPVGSLDSCQSTVSGYQGVYDLVGNASEWEDSCDSSGPAGNCRLRGGSFFISFNLSCAYEISATRDGADSDVGFRCCSSP